MQLQYPENIFENITIFNEVFNYVKESNKKKILAEMLKINPMHINETEERLKKINSSKYFTFLFIFLFYCFFIFLVYNKLFMIFRTRMELC